MTFESDAAAALRLALLAERDPTVVLNPDRDTLARRDLGEHPGRYRYLDLHRLTLGRWRNSLSDGVRWYDRGY